MNKFTWASFILNLIIKHILNCRNDMMNYADSLCMFVYFGETPLNEKITWYLHSIFQTQGICNQHNTKTDVANESQSKECRERSR